MRAVLQRVSRAKVTVDGKVVSEIGTGLLVLLGIENTDDADEIPWLCKKIVNLRIFNDDAGVMNRSVLEVEGDIIVVSQFTLYALVKKGNRPSYIKAARPEMAIPLYEHFVRHLEQDLGRPVGTGVFGADMKVDLLNEGPVTLLIDTKNKE